MTAMADVTRRAGPRDVQELRVMTVVTGSLDGRVPAKAWVGLYEGGGLQRKTVILLEDSGEWDLALGCGYVSLFFLGAGGRGVDRLVKRGCEVISCATWRMTWWEGEMSYRYKHIG